MKRHVIFLFGAFCAYAAIAISGCAGETAQPAANALVEKQAVADAARTVVDAEVAGSAVGISAAAKDIPAEAPVVKAYIQGEAARQLSFIRATDTTSKAALDRYRIATEKGLEAMQAAFDKQKKKDEAAIADLKKKTEEAGKAMSVLQDRIAEEQRQKDAAKAEAALLILFSWLGRGATLLIVTGGIAAGLGWYLDKAPAPGLICSGVGFLAIFVGVFALSQVLLWILGVATPLGLAFTGWQIYRQFPAAKSKWAEEDTAENLALKLASGLNGMITDAEAALLNKWKISQHNT